MAHIIVTTKTHDVTHISHALCYTQRRTVVVAGQACWLVTVVKRRRHRLTSPGTAGSFVKDHDVLGPVAPVKGAGAFSGDLVQNSVEVKGWR